MSTQLVQTPVGQAAIDWFEAAGPARAIVILGHGTATGVEAPDLQALAAALPALDVTVALVTQPYRLARENGIGGRSASDEPSLDAAWYAVLAQVAAQATPGTPLIAGGRSAGSQVACRTGQDLGAHAVIALAYPLLGPGSPRELLATGLPTLVVQGGSDPYGTPNQFPALPPTFRLVEVPLAGHMFTTAARSGGSRAAIDQVVDAVTEWIEGFLDAFQHPPARLPG